MRVLFLLSLGLFSNVAFSDDTGSTEPVSVGTAPDLVWFDQTSPLTYTHQKLLENDLPSAFSGLIELWQKSPEPYVAEHLDSLLVKGLEKDCGRSFSESGLAGWINELIIRRQVIQSPGRQSTSMIVDVLSDREIKDIRFRRWTKTKISSDSDFSLVGTSKEGHKRYNKRYNLSSRLASGLYRVTVSPSKGEPWSSWIVIAEPQAKEVLRWQTKDSWKVEKVGLLNYHCPLPVMNISVFDYVNDEYRKIWEKDYESEYPSHIPLRDVEPDRYVLAVSITHKRWQGVISIEDQQVISKTYDISVD
ncbi:DUF2861 family protein [Vibrio sp. SCSIO 43136]|uniref:DUF2861 family protein n=1 Tax=Vibrio sp. SCSIO 43136 TaxID=2819101 RepID=UPI0020760873|nr:DUF2861 family protein [Vibrio sp. SCSIO 43136]USD68231.1 DUF2861 family protein [Vibrio sp. SCSIO 43136]